MTRINLIDPSLLSDQHLAGEYKEITRVFTLAEKHIKAKKNVADLKIPAKFTLGSGHVSFFYDKIYFTWLRYGTLYRECVARGRDMDLEKFVTIREHVKQTFFGTGYWNDWKPSHEEIYLSMARVVKMGKFDRALKELTDD